MNNIDIVKNVDIENDMIKELRKLLMKDEPHIRRMIGIDSTNLVEALPIRNRDFGLWISVIDNEVIGYISYGAGTDEEAFVKAIYIAKDFRGKGYGTKLLSAFLTENPRISARVNQGNLAMYNLFNKLGVRGEKDSIFFSDKRSWPIWWSNYKNDDQYIDQ